MQDLSAKYPINSSFLYTLYTFESYFLYYLRGFAQERKNMAYVFDVKAVPSSGRHKWVLDASGKLKCYLKSPPERGLANEELIKLLAKALKLPKDQISILAGATSRNKRIRVGVNMTFDQLLSALEIERQGLLFE